jgi:hypothetical protein
MARADPQEAWLASASRRIEALPLPLPFGAAWLARIAAAHGAAPALAEAERQLALSWEALTVEQFVVRLFRARIAPYELLRWGVRRRLLPLFVRAAGREAFLHDCMRLLWMLGVLEDEPLPKRARITIRSKGVTFAIEGRTGDDRRELLEQLRDAAPGESLARLIAIVDGVLFGTSIGVAQDCTARTIELLREAGGDVGPLGSVQTILGACPPERPLTAIPRHDRETLKRIALSVESRRQTAEPSLEGFVGAFLVRTLATRAS